MFWDLQRDGITIELELYEHGQLVAYPTGARSEEDEVADPYFSIYRSTVESSREAFRDAG